MKTNYYRLRKQRGFNLIELMFAVLIMAITVNYATPAVQTFTEKTQLKLASERVYQFYRYARSEAIKQNVTLHLVFLGNGSDAWSFGVSDQPFCVPTDVSTSINACKIKTGDGAGTGQVTSVVKAVVNKSNGVKYDGITMQLSDPAGTAKTALDIDLDPARGSVSLPGNILLSTANGWQLKNTITPLGDIETCVPTGAPPITGYKTCV